MTPVATARGTRQTAGDRPKTSPWPRAVDFSRGQGPVKSSGDVHRHAQLVDCVVSVRAWQFEELLVGGLLGIDPESLGRGIPFCRHLLERRGGVLSATDR